MGVHMTAKITKLPTSAVSFYTVRKVAKGWAVMLITPHGVKSTRTAIARSHDRAEAIAYAQSVAKMMKRPFKYRGPHDPN